MSEVPIFPHYIEGEEDKAAWSRSSYEVKVAWVRYTSDELKKSMDEYQRTREDNPLTRKWMPPATFQGWLFMRELMEGVPNE